MTLFFYPHIPVKSHEFPSLSCHYPEPQLFFNSVFRVLRPSGRLILRDMTGPDYLVKLMNRVEMPLAHLLGHGDVRAYTCAEVRKLCENAGLMPEVVERRKGFRLHCVARKPLDA